MQTALTQLIEQLRISGNIHGAMEAEKFLPVEKDQLIHAYWKATELVDEESMEWAENFFNEKYNNQ